MLLLRTLRANDLPLWESPFHRKDTSLTNFRHKIVNPMIQLGHHVNLQAEHIYNWDPRKVSLITSILAEFIRHGLMNFHYRSKASLPLLLMCLTFSSGRRDDFWRRWRKLRHMLVQIHLLAGQWYEDNWQREFEERALKKFRTPDRKDVLFEPLSDYIERLSFNTDRADWEILKWGF